MSEKSLSESAGKTDLFSEFLENPAGDKFKALREALIHAPGFDFQSTALAELETLADEEYWERVLDWGATMMPEWIASPSVHQYLADAALELDDDARAAQEEYLVNASLRGLSQTGDGSPEQPYLIVHPADAYDLLESMGKEVEEQARLTTRIPALDVFRCSDGSAVHFDISAARIEGAAANPK